MTFKIGEICVGHGLVIYPEYNGVECEIILSIRPHSGINWRTGNASHGMHYQVKFSDGSIQNIREINLRRRRPPSREIDTVVSWSDCMWKPSEVKV